MLPTGSPPIFRLLEVALHALFAGLLIVVVVQSDHTTHPPVVGWLAGTLGAVYAAGAAVSLRPGGDTTRATAHRRDVAFRHGWLLLASALWLALLGYSPVAAYLVFCLFFLYLHLLPPAAGVTAVVLGTGAAVAAGGHHSGWTFGGVLGPSIGALVAIAIGLGYRALYRDAREKEVLIAELVATRAELAESARAAGGLAERARLAREIHDTVAQGLSSIQLLLHAVEREDLPEAARSRVKLARETAADDLAETRRIIAELAPAALEDRGLVAALRRACARTSEVLGAPVECVVDGEARVLPMAVETALMRIAQGALGNVERHSGARRARLTLGFGDHDVLLDIVDDGRGFNPAAVADEPGHFGLAAMRRRVEELGGTMSVESDAAAGGTAVSATLPVEGREESRWA